MTAFKQEFLFQHSQDALAYYDSYRSEVLPANLIQAQRDYFGAHTYNRVDKPGVFHFEWAQEREIEQ